MPRRRSRPAGFPAHGDTYFLVDPLDGTKEFVRGGDDYTVNIGLIDDGTPRSAWSSRRRPAGSTAGWSGEGAWLDEGERPQRDPHARALATSWSRSPPSRISTRRPPIISRGRVGACGYVAVGSSLKFCIVAEGRADIYPRLSPTSEWDTAAGHAVLLAAGGRVDGPGRRAARLWQARVPQPRLRRDRRMEGACRSAHSSSRFPAAGSSRRASSDPGWKCGTGRRVEEPPDVAAAERLDLGADQLELDVKLQRLRVPPLDDADAPGKPLRLVDRLAQVPTAIVRVPPSAQPCSDASTRAIPRNSSRLCIRPLQDRCRLIRFGLSFGLTLLRFAVYQRSCSVPLLT